MELKIEDLETNITEHDGLFALHEIICELEVLYANFDTHAMSDHAQVLRGKKEMLNEVLIYLKRVLG